MELKKYDLSIIPKLNNMHWMVVPLLVVFFSYFFLLGKDCVFEINDQLDETLFTYVLNAKYLFSGVKSYPEMLGGVPKGGMSVSACLFIPLYKLFPVFEAFMIQYVIVVASAYMGMYLCVKELTGNGFIGFLCGGMFMFLPYQPVCYNKRTAYFVFCSGSEFGAARVCCAWICAGGGYLDFVEMVLEGKIFAGGRTRAD